MIKNNTHMFLSYPKQLEPQTLAPLHFLYPKPALGGVRPEAFGINEAPILNNAYAYPNYYLFLIGCFKTIAMKDEHEKKNAY